MGHPHPLFRLFSSFQSLQLLLQIYVKNVRPVYGCGIRTHDLQNVSPPMTTRPGLMPKSSSYNSKLHCAHFDKGSLRRRLIAILSKEINCWPIKFPDHILWTKKKLKLWQTKNSFWQWQERGSNAVKLFFARNWQLLKGWQFCDGWFEPLV